MPYFLAGKIFPLALAVRRNDPLKSSKLETALFVLSELFLSLRMRLFAAGKCG